jgi:hypothetical protein
MPFRSRPTIRFLAAVHRRHVAVRIAEHAGIGFLAGAFLGVGSLITMYFTNGRSSPLWTVCATAIGAVLGSIAGFVRRPAMLDSAMETDRQLNAEDLFSTAWSFRQNDSAWARQVMALADHRSAATSPSAVLLARFGTRAWGSIGLISLMLFCASVLVQQSENSRAAIAAAGQADRASAGSATGRSSVDVEPPVRSFVGPGNGPNDQGESLNNEAVAQARDDLGQGDVKDAANSTGDNRNGSPASGAGMARTSTEQSAPLPEPFSPTKAADSGSNHGVARGGDGVEAANATQKGQPAGAGSTTLDNPGATQSPRWEGRITAPQASDGSANSDASPQYQPYSELIRQYFQRD